MVLLCLSFAVALLDQITKHLIRSNLLLGERVTVIPGLFSLSYVRNTGAAWGMLSGLNNWLIVLSALMLAAIVGFRHKFISPDRLISRIAVGLMIGGIVGNLVDRVRLGYVVDFADFYWRTHHFPAFNVADSAICIGVGLYILTQLLPRERTGDRATAQA
jgi:signal peptidase II